MKSTGTFLFQFKYCTDITTNSEYMLDFTTIHPVDVKTFQLLATEIYDNNQLVNQWLFI